MVDDFERDRAAHRDVVIVPTDEEVANPERLNQRLIEEELRQIAEG